MDNEKRVYGCRCNYCLTGKADKDCCKKHVDAGIINCLPDYCPDYIPEDEYAPPK